MTDLLEEANTQFAKDVFAMQTCGITITKVGETAECQMPVEAKHLNALDSVMGGAIFTLADFTVAVALNFKQTPAVTTSATVNFLAPAKGKLLTAIAEPIRLGRVLSYYQVNIYDELHTHVAMLTMTGFKRASRP